MGDPTGFLLRCMSLRSATQVCPRAGFVANFVPSQLHIIEAVSPVEDRASAPRVGPCGYGRNAGLLCAGSRAANAYQCSLVER